MNFSTGQKFVAQKEFGKALNVFLNLNDKNDAIYFYLGLIYFELNNFNKSIYYYNKFLKKKPNSVIGLYNLAFVKQSIGKIEEAKRIYLKLIIIDQNKIRPFYGLYTLNPNYLDKDKYKIVLDIKKNYNHSLFEQGIINYLLSKNEKNKNNFSKEIEYLENSHKLIFKSKQQLNFSSQFYHNKIIGQSYDKIIFQKNGDKDLIDNIFKPIFIIGLPRSGSTLVEAILSSSSDDTNSLGECHVINVSILEQLGPVIYSKNFDIKKFKYEINLNIIKQSILRRYHEFNIDKIKDNQIIIDKSLENFFNIETILNIFPKAKFIHTFRNPLDSIISIYQSMLPELSWTHSIDDIINYIDKYITIIDYYKRKYPNTIMDVELKEFTNNSNQFSKDIFRFCDLNWNSDVLEFYKRNDLHSKTLSFAQIRNKVSKYDKNKYEPYFSMLEKYKNKFSWLNIK